MSAGQDNSIVSNTAFNTIVSNTIVSKDPLSVSKACHVIP